VLFLSLESTGATALEHMVLAIASDRDDLPKPEMVRDPWIPKAFEYAHNFAGLITVVGFLVAFVLTKLTEQ
jgi:hypothetical protein